MNDEGRKGIIRRNDQALLPIEGGLTQPIKLPTLPELLTRVDAVVSQSIEDKNPAGAMDAAKRLLQVNRLSGPALSRVLYLLSKRWTEFGMREVFVDEAFKELGLGRDIVDRYVQIWEMIEEEGLDEADKLLVLQRTMRDQIKIAQAWAAHGLNRASIKKIAQTSDSSTLIAAIDELTQREKRATLTITLKRNGSLIVHEGKSREEIGHLVLEAKTAAGQKAIKRITNGAHLLVE